MRITNETELIVFLAGTPGGGCSLDSSPKKNWVENEGGLPNYICQIAKALIKGGKSKSTAISIAISRCKVWAAGGAKVNADTKAKAAAAIAQWEAMKAKSHAKDVVKATNHEGMEYLQLSAIGSFNTDMVRAEWEETCRAVRLQKRADAKASGNTEYSDDYSGNDIEPSSYSWITELWTDKIIVNGGGGDSQCYWQIPYTVTGNVVEFGTPQKVERQYVPVADEADDAEVLSDNEASLLADVLGLSQHGSALAKLTALARKG